VFKLRGIWIWLCLGVAVIALGACGSSSKSSSGSTGTTRPASAASPEGGKACFKQGAVAKDSSGTILYCKPATDGRLRWEHPRNRISVVVAGL
jgi:hypothetical protein